MLRANTSSGSSIITILGSSVFLGFLVFLFFILDGEATGGGVLSLGMVTVDVDWLETDTWEAGINVVVWLTWTDWGQLWEIDVGDAVVWTPAITSSSRPVIWAGLWKMQDREWSIRADAKDTLVSIVSTRSLLSSSKTLLSFWVLLWPFRLFLVTLSGGWFRALRGEDGFSIFTTRGSFAVWLMVGIASSISLPSSIPDSEDDAEERGEGEDNGEGDGGQLSEISESHRELSELSRFRLGNSSGGQSAIWGSRKVTIWNSASGSIGTTKSAAQEHKYENYNNNSFPSYMHLFSQTEFISVKLTQPHWRVVQNITMLIQYM